MKVVETQALFHFSRGLDRLELSHDFPAGGESPSPEAPALHPPVYGQGQCDANEVAPINWNPRDVEATKVGRHHETAVTVQKVYRSYRTRRKLADSAVLAEELWWQAIDYARLNHSTVSFFNFSKPETATSRWNRISLNASKVGKGLSKDAKAQKLAFQHWIEAIDPRHRYGHFLHLYYEEWCKADSGQPFFYWLDVGNGKDIDLTECSRSELRQQCIKYLGPHERELYEYIISDCKIIHKQSGKLLHTVNAQGDKWIFVMSTSRRLYAGVKNKGHFHHSSFLAGGATFAAGKLDVENGILKSIAPFSGHYRPTEDIFDSFIAFLMESGVNFDQVQVKRGGDDSDTYDSGSLEGNEMVAKVLRNMELLKLQIPIVNEDSITTSDVLELEQSETVDRYNMTLSGGLQSPKTELPSASILQRINSKKSAGSYQLGKQLSRTWSSGAGPRIGCVADYPVELRVQALEFVNLSPRTPHTPSSYWLTGGLTSPTDQVNDTASHD